ncbi:MAG: hypothetical protein Q8O03_05630 [Nanoarchaeota archaeon]|nr:hypothetical protein [Nanoarchaeota archaeon]
MKQKIIGLLAATALSASLATGCTTLLKNVAYTVPVAKVEKVEKHLKGQVLGLGALIFGDLEKVDEVRSCLVLDWGDVEGNPEAILTGISQKGEIFYLLTGKSEIELTDYKDNGYGSVDEIFLRYDDNNFKIIKEPTKEQLNTANKIYEIVLDSYDKLLILKDQDVKYVKTSGEKLDKLIEELKSYK